MGLSVESPMPMEIMLNPVLADEPPVQVDKMESIFMKGDQIKNIKSMNIDEKEIMDSINKQSTQQMNNENAENIYDVSDLIAMGKEKPAAFSIATDESKATINWKVWEEENLFFDAFKSDNEEPEMFLKWIKKIGEICLQGKVFKQLLTSISDKKEN